MGKGITKKIFKALGILVAVFLVIDFLVVTILFVPAVQTYVVNKLTQSLSEKWGTEISIGSVHITPTLRLAAKQVSIKDHHGENMIYGETVRGRLWSVQTKPFKLGLRDVVFEKPDIVLRIYDGEDLVNVAEWAHRLKTSDKDVMFILTSNTAEIHDGRFVFVNDNIRKVFDTAGTPPIDYAFFELTNINAKTRDFYLEYDDVAMKFDHLSFKQYGGFEAKDCSGNFRINSKNLIFDDLRLKTPDSDLDLDLKFSYDDWATYAEFLDSVRIDASVRPSVLAMDDVADFAPAIRGMNQIFSIQAQEFSGVVNDFSIKDVYANWLNGNKIHGDLSIKDVTDFKNAVFNVALDTSDIRLADLQRFSLPNGKTIKTPRILNKLGTANVSGTFEGNLTEFDADLKLKTGLGPLSAKVQAYDNAEGITFNADLKSGGFNVGRLANNSDLLGVSSFDIKANGIVPSKEINANSLKDVRAQLTANIGSFPLYGYKIHGLTLDGEYSDNVVDATLESDDENIKCKAVAQLDLSHSTPFLQGSVSLDKLAMGRIATKLPAVDSATAKGFSKLIYTMQHNPDAEMSFDNLQVALNGNKIDNVNGFLGCDNVKIIYKDDSIQNERLRLTAINTEKLHKFILSSNLANASFETTYPLGAVVDSLRNTAHRLLPSLVSSVENDVALESNDGQFLKLNVRTYNTRPLTRLLVPDLILSPNAVVNIEVNDGSTLDKADVSVPFFGIRNKFRLHNFTMNFESNKHDILDMNLKGDSVIVNVGRGRLLFDRVGLSANEHDNTINYILDWHNPFNSPQNQSELEGSVKILSKDEFALSFKPGRIYLKDYECKFKDSNMVYIRPHQYEFNNLELSTYNSSVALNGIYDTRQDSRLVMAIKNLDISLVNPLLNSTSFGGLLSANLNLRNRDGKRVLLGKAVVDELFMNDSRLGDMFLVAGLNDENAMRFSGGIFNTPKPLEYGVLSEYTMQDYQDEDDIIANISGTYEKSKLAVKAVFDTLQADFLSPFLSAFSDKLTGTASGNLSFYATPDSTYMDGVVHVVDAKMGITAIGTEYNVRNQDIHFDRRGLHFANMLITDADGNTATLSGDVLHDFFKNMSVDLKIHSDRIKAINLPHSSNAIFYGTGYVGGDVAITGNSDNISFTGYDIKTLPGSKIVLQVSSANSASETSQIRFVTEQDLGSGASAVEKSSAALNFDFIFDVTNDADVVLILESLGGTLNARADGRLQLVYNGLNSDLNLYGNLLLHSGDFKLSLLNAINSKFTMVPGGTINFDGPLENMTVDLNAYKTSKTSLSNIIPAEYLTSGNANVNAGIHLTGPLMQRIEPTFSFDLPNSSNEVRNLFYTAIDTENTENMTKQFAYFLITNSFMPEDMFSGATSTGASGLSIFSNIVNNMLNNVIDSKVGSFGITYNQATETTSAEYGIKANANILKDKMTMSTSIGYYDDRSADNAYNNIYGNFSVEYNINKSGTWRLKAYTYIGERDDNYYYNENYNNYTAGVALAYKQDFDFKKKKKKKKSNEQQQ